MPRIATNYSNTIIYKLACKDLNVKNIYIGHTTTFKDRKYQHKAQSNNLDNHQRVYEFIRENGGWSNWEMLEIEKFPCADGNEARARERFYFEELQADLNMINPIITKEEELERHREYNIVNRDKITEYNQDVVNKERASIWQKERWIKIKADEERYEKVKEQCKEAKIKRDASMTEEEKEAQRIKTNDKLKEKLECICGVTITRGSKPFHLKSKKHQKFLETQTIAVECNDS